MQSLPQSPNSNFVDWWNDGRKTFEKADRRCFDTLVILTSWIIWKERNRRTFDHANSTVEDIVSLVFDEATAWVRAGYCTLESFLLNCGVPFRRSIGRESLIV